MKDFLVSTGKSIYFDIIIYAKNNSIFQPVNLN